MNYLLINFASYVKKYLNTPLDAKVAKKTLKWQYPTVL